MLPQQGMAYCRVYHRKLFLPGFLLPKEPSSCVTGDINYNKEDLKIMSSLTQNDDHQSSDVLFLIWECDNVDRRVSKGNKECWYCGFCGNEYNICNYTKSLMNLTRSGGQRIAQCRGEITPKY